MQQVIQSYKDGKISLSEVPAPACKSGGVLVRNVASLISVGTEKLMIEMGQKSLLGKARARPDLVRQAWAKARKEGFLSVYKEAMNRLDEPIPLGYSSAGIVLEVGSGVQEFKPGDRVAVVGAGYASHAEVVWVPENLCAPIPEGIDFEIAAFGMLGCIALHGVREAALTLGEKAVVIGLGLLGLLTVQFLSAQGCRVIGVDLDGKKCELAKELGAELALVPGPDNIEEAVLNLTEGSGADAVLIVSASKDNQPLLLAEAVARARARLVLVGVADISLTRKAFWEKELSFFVSKAAGPGSLAPLYEAKGFDYPIGYVRWTERRNLEAFLDLLAQGKVSVDRLITHRFPIQEALTAYDLILKNQEPYIGILLTYPHPDREATSQPLPIRKVFIGERTKERDGANRLHLGLIGAGLFTKAVLMPIIKKVNELRLIGVATTSGTTSHHLAQKYGFQYATTDAQEILQDPAIGSVMITTRHNLHGHLVLDALKAGKHVFVEKPLCIHEDELEEIQQSYNGSHLLMVGFNRRFAPLAQTVKAWLNGRTTPLVMSYRVNAGYIPDDSWVHDPEVGGGRLLGEVCHFIDFLCFMADSEPIKIYAHSISGKLGKYRSDDNLSLTLTFADGSLGTITYTAKGSKAFSRERFEVFCEESVAVIEDFRILQMIQGGRTKQKKLLSMDMGYLNEMNFFFGKDAEKVYFADIFNSYVISSRASFKALESLKRDMVINIP